MSTYHGGSPRRGGKQKLRKTHCVYAAVAAAESRADTAENPSTKYLSIIYCRPHRIAVWLSIASRKLGLGVVVALQTECQMLEHKENKPQCAFSTEYSVWDLEMTNVVTSSSSVSASVGDDKLPDTLNKHWKNDKSGFGFRMLQKMGWKEDKGLGKDESGIVDAIRIKKREEGMALGANEQDCREVSISTAI